MLNTADFNAKKQDAVVFGRSILPAIPSSFLLLGENIFFVYLTYSLSLVIKYNRHQNNPHPRREPGGPGVAALPLLNLGAASVWLLPCNRT
jgi:hypothetical protein